MRWTLVLVAGVALVALLSFLALDTQAQTTPAVAIPDALQNGGGPTTNAPTPPPGLNLLQFDDGAITNGTGCNANPNGQVLMRFGGTAPTTGLVPFQLRGLYWQIYPGFEGNPGTISANVWYPLTTMTNIPTNTATPFFQFAATTNTMAGFKSALFAGPTISATSGNVLAGVGVAATTAWFVAYESNSPSNRRFGACGSPIAFYLPGGANVANDAHIRLLVDGNVPVELETFTID